MKKIAVGDLGEFWYGDYKEPFVQLEGGVPGHPQGVVLKDDDGKIMCAFDGQTFDNLGQHVRHKHGMHASDYKREVGLLQKSALVSERVRQEMSRGSLKRHRMYGLPPNFVALMGRTPIDRGASARAGKETPEALNKTGRCYAQVVAAGQAVLREHGRVTEPLMAKRGIFRRRIEMYFGSWENYRKLLGAPKGRKVFTGPQLLAALQSLAGELGRTPSQSDIRRFGLPTDKAYRNHFGSYSEACRRAGLDPNLPAPYTDDLITATFVAYATTGSLKRTAELVPMNSTRIGELFQRYGAPFSLFGDGGADTTVRRAWAGEMAKRIAGSPLVAETSLDT